MTILLFITLLSLNKNQLGETVICQRKLAVQILTPKTILIFAKQIC